MFIYSEQTRYMFTHSKLGSCLFGAVKSTKNVGPDRSGYSGYGIDAQFSLAYDEWDRNIFIFRVDKSSVHSDKIVKTKKVKTARPNYSINIIKSKKSLFKSALQWK